LGLKWIVYFRDLNEVQILALATVSTAGIGFAIAEALAAKGARVIITLSPIKESIHQQSHS